MLKQTLSHKLLQKLSPQQIQLMKLLQVPTMELEQRIKEEIEENPALEEGAEEKDEYDDDYGDEAEVSESQEDFDTMQSMHAKKMEWKEENGYEHGDKQGYGGCKGWR